MAGEEIPAMLLDNPAFFLSGGNVIVSFILLSIVLQQRKVIMCERGKSDKIMNLLESLNLDEKTKQRIKSIIEGGK